MTIDRDTLDAIPCSGSRPIRRDSAQLRGVSSTFGPYAMSRKIGSGGMGTVYLACDERQAGAHRFAAVKLIHAHLAEEPEFVDMFFDEADISSRIEHPHVVRTFDYGEIDDTPYLAMEYLRGESFARVFRARAAGRCPWSTERACALVARALADACEGVHAAHELVDQHGAPLGVVHRDVSPQNVFLTYQGVVKVLDFGTVKTAGQRHHTRTGFVKGKFAYVAPEILQSQPFDRRADVWSLGVLLWELLTKQRLFYRDTEAQTLQAVLTHEPRPPSHVDPSIPPIYDEAVMTALQRNPDDRFPSARDLGRALESILIAQGQLVDLGSLSDWMEALFPPATHDEPATLLFHRRPTSVATASATIVSPSEPSEPSKTTPPSRVHALLSFASALVSALCLTGVATLELTDNAHAATSIASASLSTTATIDLPTPKTTPRAQQTPATPPGPFTLELSSRDDDGDKELLQQQPVDSKPPVPRRVLRPPRVYGYSYDTLPHDI